MKRLEINDIQKLKNKRPIVCITSYTQSITSIVEKYVDILLVGDSLGTAIYGMKNTQSVTLNHMKEHGRTVYNNSSKPFTIIDMPYKTYTNNQNALINAKKLLSYTKCQSIKLEVNENHLKLVSYLSKRKINVTSHIGVRPQEFKDFSKIRIVGKKKSERNKLINLALHLEDSGTCILLLECIDKEAAKEISSKVRIPTIGIGSSINCDGQILVVNDILGLSPNFNKPKFVKTYKNLSINVRKAIKEYSKDVRFKKFPNKKYSYE